MNYKKTATIFDIQKCSFIDGPGIRTTVFFKGCNLKCKWCHNPESQRFEREMMFKRDKCTDCGKCTEICHFKLETCDFCGKCAIYCPSNAREVVGRCYGIDELFEEIRADKLFYDTSGGGVTFSGGECLLQTDALAMILKKCKEEGISTAIDTAGYVSWESFEKVIPYTDIFLYDVKAFSEELHKEGCGVSNKLILENLKKLSELCDKEIIVRIPVIRGYNADVKELKKIADFLAPLRINKVELLPYHRMGENKYLALGRDYTAYEAPSDEEMTLYNSLFEKTNTVEINVTI